MGYTDSRTATDLVAEGDRAAAAHLRAERARVKMKQAELARLTGLSVNTISRIETGERTMSLSQLFAICNALGIAPGDFLNAAQANMRQ